MFAKKSRLAILLGLLLASAAHADIVLQTLEGKNIPFESLKGKWVLINYWASWCRLCLDEIPELNRFYAGHKKQVALFGVNYDALPSDQQLSLMKQFNIHYPALQQDPAEDLNLGDIRGVPMTFVFNPQGELVQVLSGEQTVESLSQAVGLS